MLASAVSYYGKQRTLNALAVRGARQAGTRGPAAVAAQVQTYQAASVVLADTAADAMLAEQGISTTAAGSLNAPSFVSSGGGLVEMIEATANDAALDRMVSTLVSDAGRSGMGVATAIRPGVTGHIRYVNSPSCARCAILAGRFYRWSSGFQRHPHCFPAGVVVSGPATLGATRRRYEGELVILRTASGEELPATGNHPVLTDKGWVPANLLQVGDHVVRSTRPEGALPLVVPDEQQAPALIQDVRRSDGMMPLGVVPTATKDFHGDGGHGEVDVVLADRLLRGRLNPTLAKFGHQEQFAGRVAETLALSGDSPSEQLLLGMPHATDGLVGGGGLRGPLLGGHATGSHLACGGHVAEFDTLLYEALADDSTRDAIAEAERVLTLSGAVRRRDVGGRQALDAPRWDAPAGPLSGQNRGAYASRGRDLGQRLAGQVELDRLVEVRRVSWSGHVYNLTSAEGWFSANGLIVSNCDCQMVPSNEIAAPGLISDPMEAFEKGQITGLSKADTQAILDGADLGQVVNVRRTAAGLTEGSSVLVRGSRLTPEGVYRIASDRDEAIAMLRQQGYFSPTGRPRAAAAAAPPADLPFLSYTPGSDSPGFTAAEQEAITAYQLNGFHDVNEALRGQRAMTPETQAVIDQLDGVLARSALDADTTLYRGVQDRFAGLEVGAEFNDAAFLSTSMDETTVSSIFADAEVMRESGEFVESVVIRLEVPQGTNALRLDSADEFYAREKEVLLRRDARFRIVREQKGVPGESPTILWAELLP